MNSKVRLIARVCGATSARKGKQGVIQGKPPHLRGDHGVLRHGSSTNGKPPHLRGNLHLDVPLLHRYNYEALFAI